MDIKALCVVNNEASFGDVLGMLLWEGAARHLKPAATNTQYSFVTGNVIQLYAARL